MWFVCENGHMWKRSKIDGHAAHELDPKQINSKCRECGSKDISWILNPQYKKNNKKESIGIFCINDVASLNEPCKRNDDGDPRGPIESDFKLFLTERDKTKEIFFWFPYWITIKDKKKFGQYSPIILEKDFVELLENAIKKGFFQKESLGQIKNAIDESYK